jgi:two-component system chemotaxis response regulator CheY
MGYSILVVDDSATTRAIIKRVLGLAQIPTDFIAEAANGKEALSALAGRRFDLVLADLNMPEMGGLEMTRCMHENPATQDIPVVVVSAEPNAEKFAQVQGNGIQGCLRKPFTPEGIRNIVNHVLGGVHA